jgi:hypothetical protein
MSYRRSVSVAMLGVVVLGNTGCDLGTPPSGSRAIVAAQYLEKQRVRIQQIRSSLKARALPRSTARR